MKKKVASALVFSGLMACADQAPTRPIPGGSVPVTAKAPTNPTSTWLLPLDDVGLSIRSDHNPQFSVGSYSSYANGECSVTSIIYSNLNGKANNGFTYPRTKPAACGRMWTVTYADGHSETLAYYAALSDLQHSGYSIPIGSTALRHFRFGGDRTNQKNPVLPRCSQGLVFGENGANPAPGSDSVQVTRIDASTWLVESQPAPANRAYCIDNGSLYEMQVRLLIKSDTPLP